MTKAFTFLFASVLCLVLLVGCSSPATTPTPPTVEEPVEGPARRPVTETPNDELENLRTELLRTQTDLENAQAAYRDLQGTYERRIDTLERHVANWKQAFEDECDVHRQLEDRFNALAIEKTELNEELVRIREEAYFELRELQFTCSELQTELDCLHTNWTRYRTEYSSLNDEELPAGHFMIPNEDEYKEAYENLQGEYSELRGATESLHSRYALLYANTTYLDSNLDTLLSGLNELATQIEHFEGEDRDEF